MADVKISALPNASALDGTEEVPLVQGGVTSKTTAQDIADLNPGVSLATGATLFLNRQASNATGTVAFPTNFLPAAGSTYGIGGLSLSFKDGYFDAIRKINGVTMWDITNNRINDNSGNPSIYLDAKLLRTGTHGAPVTKLDYSAGVILANSVGVSMLGCGASAISFNMNLLPNTTLARGIAIPSNTLAFVSSNSHSVSDGTDTVGNLTQGATDPGGGTADTVLTSVQVSTTNKSLSVYTHSDANNNATATKDLFLGTGNKSAGTGDTGNVNIRPGVSTGGATGKVQIQNDATSFVVPKTITAAATTGNQTINKISGTVNIAATGTTVTVTCAQCATTSIVFAVVRTGDATAVIKNVVPGAGSFVITTTAAVTAETSIGFLVMN